MYVCMLTVTSIYWWVSWGNAAGWLRTWERHVSVTVNVYACILVLLIEGVMAVGIVVAFLGVRF